MKEIQLTQGKVALVDDEDYEWLNQWKWYYSSFGYAQSKSKIQGKQKSVFMHRLILSLSKGDGIDVDHINGCKIDNRRINIRKCSRSENMMNLGMKSNNTSGYKGVSFHKASKLWRSQIRLNMKSISLGYFKSPESAYEAYCAAAAKYHGEFAKC